MTSVEAALVGAITKEFSSVLNLCRTELRKIEDALGQWYEEGSPSETFPITELQRLDMITQVQIDLSRIAEYTGSALASGNGVDERTVTGILEVTTLNDLRSRFARAGGQEKASADPVATPQLSEDGTPEFF